MVLKDNRVGHQAKTLTPDNFYAVLKVSSVTSSVIVQITLV